LDVLSLFQRSPGTIYTAFLDCLIQAPEGGDSTTTKNMD
jgi:hypothetical protein